MLLSSDRYLLGPMADHPAFNRLELNGSEVNILDRTKIRVSFEFLGPQTEEALTIQPPVVTRAGHVRVVLDGGNVIAYRSLFVNRINVDLTTIPFTPLWGRFSVDLSPAASGSLYYDPNVPDGVLIDGVPDSIAISPAADWSEVSGATGTIVRIIDFAGAGGAAATYYKDDQSADPNDTGDKKSYGDAGVQVENPLRKFVFSSWNYILPAGQPNVGATYKGYTHNPLQVEATEQASPGQPTNTPTPTLMATVTATVTHTPTATAAPRKIYLPLSIRA